MCVCKLTVRFIILNVLGSVNNSLIFVAIVLFHVDHFSFHLQTCSIKFCEFIYAIVVAGNQGERVARRKC